MATIIFFKIHLEFVDHCPCRDTWNSGNVQGNASATDLYIFGVHDILTQSCCYTRIIWLLKRLSYLRTDQNTDFRIST